MVHISAQKKEMGIFHSHQTVGNEKEEQMTGKDLAKGMLITASAEKQSGLDVLLMCYETVYCIFIWRPDSQ